MKPRALKKLGIVLGSLLLALVVLAAITPLLLDLNRYHDFIVSEIETTVGGKVTLGRISWGITHQIWMEVDGFSITDAPAFPGHAQLTRAYASVSLPQLLTKKVVVKHLQLESSEAAFRLEPTPEEVNQPASGTPSTDADLPVEIEIQRLTVAIKRFQLDDALSIPGQTLEHVFSDVDLSATHVAPTEVMTLDLSFKDQSPSGFGTVKARGTFSGLSKALTLVNPQLELKAALAGAHVDAITPYLQNDELSGRLAGTISTDVEYAGDLGENLRAKGTIDLSKLLYSDPSLWDAAIPGQNTTLQFQLNLDPENLTAEKIILKLGALTLEARGVLHSWSKEPVVKNAELTSDLLLRDLIPLIPWKQLGNNAASIRAILEEGGSIAVDKLTLPEISLANPPTVVADMLPGVEMEARVAGVSVQATPEIPKLENIEGAVLLADGVAQIAGVTATMASVDLPPVSARVTNLLEDPKVFVNIDGPLALNAMTDEKFRILLESIGLEEVLGAADLNLTVAVDTARASEFQLEGDVELKDLQLKSVYTAALIRELNAKVAITPAQITLSQASAFVALPAAAAASPDEHFTIDVQGQVDDWRDKPLITLQNFKTSRIELPMLASMVPWEKLEQSAKPARELLDAGGYVQIDVFSFPSTALSKLSEDPKLLLPRTRMAARIGDITVPADLSPVEINGIAGQIELENNVLTANDVRSRLGPIALPVLNMRATDIADQFKATLQAKGPLRVAASGDEKIQKLLLGYGLKDLSISAEIDVSAAFDQRKPEEWTARGLLDFHDVRATSHPAAVVLDELKGRVTFKREKTLSITTKKLTARINRAPVGFSGKVVDIGSPRMLVSANAYARKVDLAHLAELLPALRGMKLEGVLELVLNAHVPYAAPAESRLKGTLAASNVGFQLPAANLVFSQGNTNVKLIGDGADIEAMTMQVNDQKLALSGYVSNPVEPNAKLLLTSPSLNLDRLLPADKSAQTQPVSTKGEDGPAVESPKAAETASKNELPPLARKSTVALKVQADRGQYKGLQFEKLDLDVHFKKGVVEIYSLSGVVDEGRIATKGSADLRDLDRIGFTVDPDVSDLQLALIAPALGIDKLPVEGPLTLQGRLRGHTGSGKELLASLDGKLTASLGQGTVNNIGTLGGIFATVFSMANVTSIFSGRLFKDFAREGIPFQTISAESAFDNGNLNLEKLHFGSDALTIDGHGTIDLIHETLKVETVLVPLATVDKTLNYVPIVGKALQDVTRIAVDIEGPLKDPKVSTAEFKQIGKGIESGIEQPKSIIKGIGEGLEKMF